MVFLISLDIDSDVRMRGTTEWLCRCVGVFLQRWLRGSDDVLLWGNAAVVMLESALGHIQGVKV